MLSLLDASGKIRWSIPTSSLADDATMPVGAIVKPDVIYLVLADRWGESVGYRDFHSHNLELVHLTPAGKVIAKFRLW